MGRSDTRRIIGAEKRILDDGSWQDGKMSRGAFPLSKSGNKAYRLGNRRWRVVRLDAAGVECCLLITFNFSLREYQALFGVYHAGDVKILASLEHHANHSPPWHAHLCCDALSTVPAGVKRGPWNKRFKATGARYRGFPNSDRDAFNMAARFFRLAARPGGEHGLL